MLFCFFLESVAVQLPSCIQLFVTPWTVVRQASLSLSISQSLPKFMSIESVMPSNHFILCHPLLLLPSVFPSIRVFPLSQLFRAVSDCLPLFFLSWGAHLLVSLSFCLFIQFMGFSWQEYWSGLPLPPPMDHVLSEFSTVTVCLGWSAWHDS